MLISFQLFLRPEYPTPLVGHVGRSLNGLFFSLLQQADPALATRVHEQMPLKPFTVSPLQGRFRHHQGQRQALPTERYIVRYTVLSREVFQAVSHVLLAHYLDRQQVLLDQQPFVLERIGVAPHDADPQVMTTSYETLHDRAERSRIICLHFASPTAFKLGKQHLMFPDPYNVFGNLLRTWQAFAPFPLAEDLPRFVAKQVWVSRYQLETQVIPAGRYELHGFVGACEYRIRGEEVEKIIQLNTLADFALFAGIGMKSTQGMGQGWRVRDIESDREFKRRVE